MKIIKFVSICATLVTLVYCFNKSYSASISFDDAVTTTSKAESQLARKEYLRDAAISKALENVPAELRENCKSLSDTSYNAKCELIYRKEREARILLHLSKYSVACLGCLTVLFLFVLSEVSKKKPRPE